MIAFHTVEPDLVPERVDQRLAAGWFPYGQHWMTCRIWPDDEVVAVDTVWLRVRLRSRPRSDRHRRLLREGMTVHWSAPSFDAEHQALYDRHRSQRDSWRSGAVSGLLLHDFDAGPLFARTREASLRDHDGRLLAFRWFVEGRAAVAGITVVYDPEVSGLGTVARYVVDQDASERGLTWSYPGYLRPGAADPWDYKLKAGRTEWLHPVRGEWRSWDVPPRPAELEMAELRRRLAPFGEVRAYPRWAVPWFDARSSELASPLYVVTGTQDRGQVVVVWDVLLRRYRSLLVTPGTRDGEATLDVLALLGAVEPA